MLKNLIRLSLEFPEKCLFVTFISGNFLPMVNKHSFHVFISEAQNDQEFLLFVHWK